MAYIFLNGLYIYKYKKNKIIFSKYDARFILKKSLYLKLPIFAINFIENTKAFFKLPIFDFFLNQSCFQLCNFLHLAF
tara:strand:- start:97 stop:330 length:234 start_codon:yes stop_codon:yes gene_type:complete